MQMVPGKYAIYDYNVFLVQQEYAAKNQLITYIMHIFIPRPVNIYYNVNMSSYLEFEEFCQLSAKFLIEEDEEGMKKELKEAFRIYDKAGQSISIHMMPRIIQNPIIVRP